MSDSSIEQISELAPPEDVRRYEQDGVVALRGVLSASQIDLLREAVDHQLSEWATSPSAYDFQDLAQQMWRGAPSFTVNGANRFDMDHYHAVVSSDQNARPLFDSIEENGVKPGKFFYDAAGWRRFPGIREVAMDSCLPELAAGLMRSTYVNFWEDTTFV